MNVTLCGFRGEVISKAGPEEAIIYADIGERGGRFNEHQLTVSACAERVQR